MANILNAYDTYNRIVTSATLWLHFLFHNFVTGMKKCIT